MCLLAATGTCCLRARRRILETKVLEAGRAGGRRDERERRRRRLLLLLGPQRVRPPEGRSAPLRDFFLSQRP